MNLDYSRLSRDEDKAHYTSIENQKKIIQRYAKEKGITIDKSFEDDGYSGYTMDRPAFNEIMHLIDENRVDVLIAKDLSRLGRHNANVLLFLERAKVHGVRIILVDDNYNVWLIEVNVGPSMHCSSLLDTSIKSDLFSDIVNIIGVKFYNHYDRDKCYTMTKEETVDKTFDKLYVNAMKREVYKEFNKDNLKFKGRAYDSNYYQDVINKFIEEKCRSEVTDFEMIFPCKGNITFYSKFILNGNNGNSFTNDDTIVIWQYLLTH